MLIDNLSNRHYPGLHMTMFIDGGVIGVDRNVDGDGIEDRLPPPPTAWGSSLMATLSGVRIADRFDPSPQVTRREMWNGDPSVIRLAELDLRAWERYVTIEDELVMLVPAERETPLIVRWEATAANIDGVVEGSFELPVSDDVLDLLLEAVRRDGRLAEQQEEEDPKTVQLRPTRWAAISEARLETSGDQAISAVIGWERPRESTRTRSNARSICSAHSRVARALSGMTDWNLDPMTA